MANTFHLGRTQFSETPLMQTVWDPKNATFIGNSFYMWQLSQKHIVHYLRLFKESFMVALFEFLNIKMEI